MHHPAPLGRRLVLAALAAVMPLATPHARQAPPQDQPRPSFSVSVTLVTTDVIVRDERGQFVSDLTKDDFVVLEDGRPQALTSFVMVQGGRSYNLVTPPPPPSQEGIILPSARRTTTDTSGRVLLLFVDDLHLEALNTHHVRALLQRVVGTLLHEGDLVAMISTGTSAVEVPLTYDHALIKASIDKVTGNGLTFADITTLTEGPQGPAHLRERAATAFRTAYDIITDLERVQNRRKAVLWVSQGYDFNPFVGARRGTDRVFGGRYGTPFRDIIDDTNPFFRSANVFADVDLTAQLRELTRAANRANATLFTLDPRGLVGTTDAGQQIDMDEWGSHLLATQGSLRYLAEATGGLAVLNSNDFDPALKRIDAETSDYYVLGYYSDNPDPTQRVRQLEITVKRPGVTVASRRSYSVKENAPPPSPPRPR